MCNSKRSGSFFPCLFINMLLNIEGLLPAVILLVLHFWPILYLPALVPLLRPLQVCSYS